ncbi:MAG: lysophospholipid acyltransferase family protein [Mangrovibacterium sp.]
MTKTIQSFTVFFLKAFARLPFWMIYIISDFLYVIIFHIVRYRRKVVYTNLKNSFPEKSKSEIDLIAHRYYRHFCDLILESIKGYRMSAKDISQRFKVNGIERTNAYAEQGKSIVLIGMHYNNWEWSALAQPFTRHQLLVVFNPLRNNDPMENFLTEMREQYGSKTVPINHSARTAMQFNKAGKPTCLFLAADQTPPRQSHFWTTFLHQETPFFEGPERIAIKTNQPVFLHHTRKTGRGKYEVDLIELFPEPEKVEPNTILLTYVDMMEKIIREKPEYWLWSHRRWKHKRPEHTPLIPRQ